jgi:tRNA(Ile2) C34 agmatinyltransferase TiaS
MKNFLCVLAMLALWAPVVQAEEPADYKTKHHQMLYTDCAVMLELKTETRLNATMEGPNPVCPKCGCDKPKTFVHGHYQCADCKCIADGDCCQGQES